MLLSFRPDVYEKIKSGVKIFEHRRNFPDEPIMAYMYVSSPVKAITGVVYLGKRHCLSDWMEDYKEDGDWAYYVKSVIVFGRAKVVEDEKETLRMTRLIGLKYYPTVKEVDAILERTRGRVQGVRVDVEKMTGKLVHEK